MSLLGYNERIKLNFTLMQIIKSAFESAKVDDKSI